MTVRLTDETDFGVGWIEDAAEAKTGHALVVDGRVWLVDPIEPEGVEERVLALGEPAGVLQLLDRHNRAAAAMAARLERAAPRRATGAAGHAVHGAARRAQPALEGGRALVAGARASSCAPTRSGRSRSSARASEPVGVHPALRLKPPRGLVGLGPEHLLVGHGDGLHGPGTAAAVDDAVRNARRRIPRWLRGLPRIVRRGS